MKIWYSNSSTYNKFEEFNTLEGHTNVIQALDVSEDGEILASVSFDHTIRVWKMQEKDEIETGMIHFGGGIDVPSNYELF